MTYSLYAVNFETGTSTSCHQMYRGCIHTALQPCIAVVILVWTAGRTESEVRNAVMCSRFKLELVCCNVLTMSLRFRVKLVFLSTDTLTLSTRSQILYTYSFFSLEQLTDVMAGNGNSKGKYDLLRERLDYLGKYDNSKRTGSYSSAGDAQATPKPKKFSDPTLPWEVQPRPVQQRSATDTASGATTGKTTAIWSESLHNSLRKTSSTQSLRGGTRKVVDGVLTFGRKNSS